MSFYSLLGVSDSMAFVEACEAAITFYSLLGVS